MCQMNCVSLIRNSRSFLLAYCLLLSACASDDVTQLVMCSANNERECVVGLLEAGVDVNGRGKEGASPFYAAVYNENFALADLLLQYGANVNGRNQGVSYLTALARHEKYSGIEYLITSGYSVSEDEYERLAIEAPDVLSLLPER